MRDEGVRGLFERGLLDCETRVWVAWVVQELLRRGLRDCEIRVWVA